MATGEALGDWITNVSLLEGFNGRHLRPDDLERLYTWAIGHKKQRDERQTKNEWDN